MIIVVHITAQKRRPKKNPDPSTSTLCAGRCRTQLYWLRSECDTHTGLHTPVTTGGYTAETPERCEKMKIVTLAAKRETLGFIPSKAKHNETSMSCKITLDLARPLRSKNDQISRISQIQCGFFWGIGRDWPSTSPSPGLSRMGLPRRASLPQPISGRAYVPGLRWARLTWSTFGLGLSRSRQTADGNLLSFL